MSKQSFQDLLDEMIGQKIASLRLGSPAEATLEVELKNGRFYHLRLAAASKGVDLVRGPMDGDERRDATELAPSAFKGGPVINGVSASMLGDYPNGIVFDFSTGATLAYGWQNGVASFR